MNIEYTTDLVEALYVVRGFAIGSDNTILAEAIQSELNRIEYTVDVQWQIKTALERKLADLPDSTWLLSSSHDKIIDNAKVD